MSKNFFFIDDSGSKEWETPYSYSFVSSSPPRTEQNLNFWRRNYFVLAGLHIPQKIVAELNPKIDALKKDTFGTKYVEIKLEWVRNPFQQKKRYLGYFNIAGSKLKDFTEKWYTILSENVANIQIQSFILDKRFYKNKRNEYTPLQILTQVLFDRVELHPSRECEIIFDQMDSEIKSEKNRHGEILKISSKQIDLGSFQKKYSHIKPRFEKSCNSNFLQLADTVAYNILRQFIEYGDIWEDKEAKHLKTYPFFDRISPNFYQKNGQIAGFGLVKVPDFTKNNWSRDSG